MDPTRERRSDGEDGEVGVIREQFVRRVGQNVEDEKAKYPIGTDREVESS